MPQKPCSFDRGWYLRNEARYENEWIENVDDELVEFDGDAARLALELAYTRYYLAKAEQENERLNMCLDKFALSC